jgi:hypothetical protein
LLSKCLFFFAEKSMFPPSSNATMPSISSKCIFHLEILSNESFLLMFYSSVLLLRESTEKSHLTHPRCVSISHEFFYLFFFLWGWKVRLTS